MNKLWWAVPVVGQFVWLYEQYSKYTKPPGGAGVPFGAQYGKAVPVLFGRVRHGGLTVVYARRVDATSAPAILLAGHGTVTQLLKAWKGSDASVLPNWTLADGTQTSMSLPPAADSARNLPYKGYALITTPIMGIAGGALSGYSFEMKGLREATGHADGDADPALVVQDILGQTAVGLGWPSSRIRTDEWGDSGTLSTRQAASFKRYCAQLGFGYSRVMAERRPVHDWLTEILDCTHSTALWGFDQAGAVCLSFVPRGDTASGSFTPYQPTRYALGTGADRFLVEGDADPLEVEIESRADVNNVCIVSFIERTPASASTDSADAYKSTTEEWADPADVARFGERRGDPVELPGITRRAHAARMAKLRCQHELYRSRYRYRAKLGWRLCRLDPLDFVTLTDTGLGLDGLIAQIAAIEEDRDGNMAVEFVPADRGSSHAIEHTTQSSDGPNTARNSAELITLDAHFTVNASNTVATWSGNIWGLTGTLPDWYVGAGLVGVSGVTFSAGPPESITITFDTQFADANYSVQVEHLWLWSLSPTVPLSAVQHTASVEKSLGSVKLTFYDLAGSALDIGGSGSRAWAFKVRVVGYQ